MLLVNGDNLGSVEISPEGLLKYHDMIRPAEYMCVQPPMKVKVDKDVLFYIEVAETEDGSPNPYMLMISPLRSTSRKFQLNYLKDVFNRMFDLSEDKQLLRRR